MRYTSPIPKVLHQIWLGSKPMPLNQQRWRRRFIERNPHWGFKLWTDANLPPIMNRAAWNAAIEIGGVPGIVLRSDILRLEILARLGGVYFDTDVKPIRPLDECCPPEVTAWVACEQEDRMTNALMGFPPNHPAAWAMVNEIERSFFESRCVLDQAGPGLVRRVCLRYDDIAFCPPARFFPSVHDVAGNPDRNRLLLQAHVFAGTWVESRRSENAGLWREN